MSAAFGRESRDEDPPPRPHEQVQAFLDSSGSSPDPWSADIADVRADAREKVLAVTGEPASGRVRRVDRRGRRAGLGSTDPPAPSETCWSGRTAAAGCTATSTPPTVSPARWRTGPPARSSRSTTGWRPNIPSRPASTTRGPPSPGHGATFDSVAVGGDSSGGNLAAAAALKARDEGVELAAQLLVYPVLDSTEDTDYKLAFQQRYAHFAGRSGFGSNSYRRLKHIWETYVPDPAVRKAPYASPLHAESVYGVAPATIITAEHDFLRGEAEEYVRRLQTAGVPVELHEYAGQIHGFFEMFTVMTDAHHAIGVAGDAVRRAFPSIPPV